MSNSQYATDIIFGNDSNLKTNKSNTRSDHILKYTQKFIHEVESLTLTFPCIDSFSPLQRLKNIPRTGKMIRLQSIAIPNILPRSVYDHVISMAHLADAFLSLEKHPIINECDYPQLGRLIAYHELNESLLGDIPAYTNLDGNSIKQVNDRKIKAISADKKEKAVNNLLWLYGNQQQRISFEELNKNLSQQKTPIMKYFKMLDRIDPIIAVWRYLFFYKIELQGNVEEFIEGMNDFFTYPKTLEYKNSSKSDFPFLKSILEILMNPAAAKKYANGASLESFDLQKQYTKIIEYLIEDVSLFTS